MRKDDDSAAYPGTLDDPHAGAALAANCRSLASMFAAKAAPTKNSAAFALRPMPDRIVQAYFAASASASSSSIASSSLSGWATFNGQVSA